MREANKNCVANLKLVEPVLKDSGRYNHVFRREKELSDLIALNDYLVVSTEKRVAIASGFVKNISSCEFTISLERDLSSHKDGYFFVDHYTSNMQLDFNLTNLGYLLEMTPQSDFLRNMIISFHLPAFKQLDADVLEKSQQIMTKLNKCQMQAVLQALSTQHYLLIKGMPGTGKTETLVTLVELLAKLGKSVLVTSHTHSAIDNILRRLSADIDILRLGSISKVHPDVKQFSEQNLVYSTPQQLETIFNRKEVVGVTCLGSAHVLLRRRRFDVVLVDEATQVLLPTTLRPLYAANRFILVGDPHQLPPLVRSQRASDQGLNQSLFSHLDRPTVTAVLSVQYRMNQCITDLANGLTYEGKLECANDVVKNATIKLTEKLDFPSWMALPLSESLDQSVVVLDSGYVSTAKFSNQREADVIYNLVTTMKNAGLDASQIGVIAPYQDQVSLIKSKMVGLAVEVSTVDTFQGRDKHIVIYSCTRSSHAKESGLLSNHNRLTVAITRAKQKLIFIGDVQTLKGYSIFQKLFSLIDPSNIVVLPDEIPS
ncbi:DNA replication ATP-dependent helicase/nuclease DNA2-like [Nilaparvata lugens]|uniref:DNA replication ATP-dependent helicase/nuclease DNA2-like n=1 Tax=Nilaparvata lugens TaxID=108931 RepID=UPI00193DF2EC|nr:DNA replication ATP-dependent helicase/nuclease DNA2-like [Nilaparvata lugens]